MTAFERLLKSYDYHLPKTSIAEAPSSPRDSARLLVYDRLRKGVTHDTFRHLSRYLPKGSVLVLNTTKVLPARIRAMKPTGGTVDLLYTGWEGNALTCLANRRLDEGMVLRIGKRYTLTVMRRDGMQVLLRPSFARSALLRVLHAYGTTPLPPYLKHSPLSERDRREKYQTVFARSSGSIAAPTASLHFTERLLADLRRRGIRIVHITLRVNLGTFAPLTPENVHTGKLHEEFYDIPLHAATIIESAKRSHTPVFAVGTTVVRALESAWSQGAARAGEGSTRLFIHPGYRFRVVDGMVTNFHVPLSSLLMLVAAFTGRTQLLRLYEKARREGYRFLSFGDAMLLTSGLDK